MAETLQRARCLPRLLRHRVGAAALAAGTFVMVSLSSGRQLPPAAMAVKEQLSSGLPSSAAQPDTIADPADFYYFEGRRIQLHRAVSELVVKFVSSSPAEQRQVLDALPAGRALGIGPAITTRGRMFHVVRASQDSVTPPDLTRIRQQLRASPGVAFVSPAFVYPETGIRVLPTDEVVAKLRPDVVMSDLAALAADAGLTIVERIAGTDDEYVLRLARPHASDPVEQSRVLYESGVVEWAEPNFLQEFQKQAAPNDPRFDQQWHLSNTGQSGGVPGADVNAVAAWNLQTGSNAVVIGIVDDGVEMTHEDLAANIFVNAGEIAGNGIDDDANGYVDDVSGWDFSNNDNDAGPFSVLDSHGTAVAGVAAARGNNATGVSGACQHCRILPVKIFSPNYAGDSAAANAIRYAAQFADVINNSWGGGAPSAVIQSAIQDAITSGRGGKGSIVLFASGNSGSGYSLYTIFGFPAGTFTFRWEYSKDATVSAGEDAAWLGWVQLPGGEHVNFESGLPAGWSTGGTAGWSAVIDPTHADEGSCYTRAIRSGAITHGQTSFVQVTKTVAAGSLFTYRWVSSEPGFDGLRVRVDFDNDGTFDQTFSLQSGVPSVVNGVSFPAAHPESIAVGASSNFDCRSHYSQFGPQVAFVAPSSAGPRNLRIESTDRTGTDGYEASGNYTLAAGASGFGGTSSSTPLAAGIAGLILSRNAALTRAQVLQIMQNTADKVGPEPYVSGRNNRYGFGRLDAHQALLNTPLGGPSAVTQAASGVASTTATLNGTVNPNGANTTAVFEYGPTMAYGAQIGVSPAPGSGVSPVAVSAGVTGLNCGTQYNFRLAANNGNGSANGSNLTFTTGSCPPPGAFSKASPADGGTSVAPAFAWGTSSGATRYEYCIDTTNDNACSTWVNAGANTSVMVAGLAGNTTHYWQVRSVGPGGTTFANGSSTAFWSFTTADLPNAPTNLSHVVNVSSVQFNWQAPASGPPPLTYVIEVGSTPGAHDVLAVTTGAVATSHLVVGVPNGTYYVRVRAQTAIGIGPASNEVVVTVNAAPVVDTCVSAPAAPTGLSFSLNGPAVSLTWTGSAGAWSYRVEVGSGSGGTDVTLVDTGSGGTGFFATVAPGTYFVRVRAQNRCGFSPPSNEVVLVVP